MSTEALMQWAAMGEHGLYVWPAYGATVLVLGAVVLSVVMDARGLREALRMEVELKAREGRRGLEAAPGSGELTDVRSGPR